MLARHPIIRPLPALALILTLAACGSGQSGKSPAPPVADTPALAGATASPSTPPAGNRMSDSMLAQIIRYYEAEYGNDSVRMSISRSDTLVELSFADTTTGSDTYNGSLLVADIPLVTNQKPVLSGDLNGDGLDDMLVTVHTEGGGGGGNVWWDDHFVFLADSRGHYALATGQGDAALVGGAGYFYPGSIAHGVISGFSNEYAENDGHCCPSRYYRLELRLENGSLRVAGKTAVPKPKSLE